MGYQPLYAGVVDIAPRNLRAIDQRLSTRGSAFRKATYNDTNNSSGLSDWYDSLAKALLSIARKERSEESKFVAGWASELGARQFAWLADQSKLPLELMVADRVEGWGGGSWDALTEMQTFLRKKVFPGSHVAVAIYDNGSSRPFEAYALGRRFYFEPSLMPNEPSGKIEASVTEDKARYGLQFVLQKNLLTEERIRNGWSEQDAGFSLLARPVHYAQRTEASRQHRPVRKSNPVMRNAPSFH